MPITRSPNRPFTRSQAAAAVETDNQMNSTIQSTQQQGEGEANPDGSPPVPPVQPSTVQTTPPSIMSARTERRSTRSNISSATVLILAAKAESARKLAKVQAERERAKIERELAQAEREAERERQVIELELQAKLAAIEAGSSRHNSRSSSRQSHATIHSRSGSQSHVEKWLNNTNNPELPLYPTVNVTQPAHAAPCATGTAPPPQTTNNRNNFYQNNNEYQNVSDSPFIQLAKAITDLGKRPNTKVCDLQRFDGHASNWLAFKRSYEQSKAHFSPGDNVARISAALHGEAKEAVSVRLLAIDDPDQIVHALETRFAQPEIIVLHQLSLVRALPRLGAHEAPREINIFACRVRNCVEVIRLLNQPDYLASPELVNSLIGKLTPLLRSRWADFAYSNINSSKFKLEILADLLENESYLQTKFGLISQTEILPVKPQSAPIKQQYVNRQSQPANRAKDKIFPYNISSEPSNSNKANSSDMCNFCAQSEHEIGNCEKFKELSLDNRWQWVLDNKVCHRCLRKGSHRYKLCKKRCKIEGCVADWRHHSLLHKINSESAAHVEVSEVLHPTVDTAAPSQQNETSSCQHATVAHSAVPNDFTRPLLKVVPVTLTGKKGSVNTFALLDDGSTTTLVDKSVANMLVGEKETTTLQINCIGGLTKSTHVSFIDMSIKGQRCPQSFDIRARSIPNLGLRTQSANIQDIQQHKHLFDLANELTYNDAKPTCLIGTDNWHLLLPKKIARGSDTEPAAALTPLGWALFGCIDSKARNNVEFINHFELGDNDRSLELLIKNYYKLDSIGIRKEQHQSPSDKRALKILEETTVHLPSGHFETGLLWRNDIKAVPNSKQLATARFSSLERKMAKDEEYAASYKNNIRAMIEKDYAELCSGPPTGAITWYLPHFGVVHPHKKKLRVVHDAAARCEGVSINSLLLSGPDLLQPLLAIVMRFREGSIALSGDIREMFPQVKIRVADRDAQRFLWRDNVNEPVKEYRMSSMIFGATSSPCTALYIKNKNAKNLEHLFPEAARSIVENHYMDDFLGSVNDVKEAAQLASDILTVHKAAGFEMRSWVSNCSEALALIPPELHAIDATEMNLGPSAPSETRILGLTWLIKEDSLCLLKSIPSLPNSFTKRTMLSLLMSVFDPL